VDELDLVQLDRRLARVVVDWARWRRRLRRGAALEYDPFAAHAFVSRMGYERVRDRPESDPLRAPMLRFLYRLVDDKANRVGLTELARARSVEGHPLDAPARVTLTLAEMLTRVLSDPGRAADWLAEFLRHAGRTAELERRVWESRRDVAERLGVDPDRVELPAEGIYDVAEQWLDATDDRAAEFREPELHLHLQSALGAEAHEGWPARLSAEALSRMFRETRLLHSLPLEPGPLPATLAPASFVRALARLGAAVADAAAPRDQPFVIAHDPYGLRRLAHGALLAGLAVDPAFLKRALGLSSSRVTEHRRVLGRVLFLETRTRALRLLLRRSALAGERVYQTAFEELTARVLWHPLSPNLAGALFAPRRDEAQRFAAMLLAAAHARVLTEEHDEDWYRNPRATEQLRADASLPPATTTTREALDQGAAELARSLFSLLG
jgi:hypothetical protein